MTSEIEQSASAGGYIPVKLAISVHCIGHDVELARIDARQLFYAGKLPFELFAQPGEVRVHVVCGNRGTSVPLPLDEWMIMH